MMYVGTFMSAVGSCFKCSGEYFKCCGELFQVQWEVSSAVDDTIMSEGGIMRTVHGVQYSVRGDYLENIVEKS